jgi:hypothetical protein
MKIIRSDDFYLSEDSSVDEEKLDIFISFRGFIVLFLAMKPSDLIIMTFFIHLLSY